jgi:hypothetical protein
MLNALKYFLKLGACLAATLLCCPSIEAATSSPVAYGVLVKIAIFPPNNDSSLSKALIPIADAINADPSHLYGAWVVGSGDCPLYDTKCLTDDAPIFVRSAMNASTYTLTSIDVIHGAVLGSASNIDPTIKSPLSSAQIHALLGSVSIINGTVVIGQQYQQFVQIVQAPNSSTDVDYAPVLTELLARRGITAVRSNFTVAQLGASPNSAICSRGERYVIYSVSMTNDSKFLTGFTRVGSKAAAFIADCPTLTSIPFAGEQHFEVPTTSASLLTYATFLAFLVPKFSWISIGKADLAFSKIVDVDPDSTIVRDDVATIALQRAVDRMCSELNIISEYRVNRQTPMPGFPTPEPSTLINLPGFTPFALPTPLAGQPGQPPGGKIGIQALEQTGSPPAGATAASGGASAPTVVPLDLSSFVGPAPPPLLCDPNLDSNPLIAPYIKAQF